VEIISGEHDDRPGPASEDIPPAPGDPRLVFRLYIEGRKVAEDIIDVSSGPPALADAVDRVRTSHAVRARRAHAAGIPWLAEVYDPGHSCGAGRWLRWGTDTSLMHDPLPVLLDNTAVFGADTASLN
jgi:hypothetical protein